MAVNGRLVRNLLIPIVKICELIIDQLVGFLVVEPVYLGSNPRLGTSARIFLDLF
jgi:hypothetical protein